ncbi:MAG: TadE/TadG family type IV pilus assembly protein [Desulfocucumaceae bacterium]
MKNILSRLIKDERGLSFILVSVGMMALFGMSALVTDFGRIALARQQMINAVDSAAMAGAKVLHMDPDPSTRELAAQQQAINVAVANGAPPGRISVNFDDGKISVDAEKTVELIMSRAFGVNSREVRTHAAALVGSVTSYRGIAPLCIREQTFTYGQLCTLKYGSPDSPGNFGALALAGKGASNYKDNLIKGFSEEVSIGEVLNTEPGNMSGPTDGIDQRLARCTDGCTYDNFRPGCPRVLIIPLHNSDLQGRDSITIRGFAVFFIDRESTISGSDEIKGYFVRMAAEGSINTSTSPTGLYAVKLVE